MSPLLIDALTISDGRFKKKCSASVFKMMLLNEEMNRIPKEIKNQALLLLATYRKLLRAIAKDLRNVKILKDNEKRRHWGKVNKVHDKVVIAKELRMKQLDLGEKILFFHTQQFLEKLPVAFIKKLVDWAPPVVSGTFLIENVLVGYIAQKLLPLEKIKAKELGKSVQSYFCLSDFFVFLPRLEELYQKYRQQIVHAAPASEIALALTDFKKAWIYSIRSSL